MGRYDMGGMYHCCDVCPFMQPCWHTGQKLVVNNGIIVAAPGAMFLDRFLSAYAHYNKDWMFSVNTAARLSFEFPSEVCLMPPQFAYRPFWIPEHLEQLYAVRTAEEMAALTTMVRVGVTYVHCFAAPHPPPTQHYRYKILMDATSQCFTTCSMPTIPGGALLTCTALMSRCTT